MTLAAKRNLLYNASRREVLGIKFLDVSFAYGEKSVLSAFSFDFDRSPAVLMGASGSGKTTLLRLASRIAEPSSGAVVLEGAERCQSAPVSFAFQEPRLLPHLTVVQNVLLPIKKLFTPKEAERRALLMLNLMRLSDKAGRFPASLSGGEASRAALARALCYPSPYLFLDEPMQSLDIPLRISLLGVIKEIMQRENRFCLAAIHDTKDALLFGGHIAVLGKGASAEHKTKIAFEAAGSQLTEERLIEMLTVK